MGLIRQIYTAGKEKENQVDYWLPGGGFSRWKIMANQVLYVLFIIICRT